MGALKAKKFFPEIPAAKPRGRSSEYLSDENITAMEAHRGQWTRIGADVRRTTVVNMRKQAAKFGVELQFEEKSRVAKVSANGNPWQDSRGNLWARKI